jgi:hypothetical protein
MFGETSTNKPATFAAMKRAGIAKAVVHFSGGNDEGGADEIRLTHGDGSESTLDGYGGAHKAHGGSWEKYEDDTPVPAGEWIVLADGQEQLMYQHRRYRKATDAERDLAELRTLLTAPVYDRYGSFAGEFYVDGLLTWNAETEKLVMGYDEEVPVSEHHEETL